MEKGKTTLPTVSVLIPAHNEEQGLPALLSQVFSQEQSGFVLEKVLVYSDGSTDQTVARAQQIADSRLTIVSRSQRKGLAAALTYLFTHSDSDIAILLNADIALDGSRVFADMVAPIAAGKADLTAARIQELSPNTFFERVLAVSMYWKKSAFSEFKGGNNMFTCYGPARAFSKRLYATIRFPFGACDDAYSYLFCMQQKLEFVAVHSASILYRLPSTLADHARQSIRYATGMRQLESVFGARVVREEASLPFTLTASLLVRFAYKNPIYFVAYIASTIGIAVLRRLSPQPDLVLWSIAKSSKVAVSL